MSKRLITDRDVLEGRCGARIVLDGDTLITPSARDRAMRLGIALVEDGMPAARCATCGSAACAGGCAGARRSSGAGTLHLGGVPGRNAGQDGSLAPGQIGSFAAGPASGAACATCAGAGCATCGRGGCATCGGGGGGGGAGTSLSPQGLPDGLYLVRIDGGRVVSTLPAAGPGLMPRATTSSVPRS